MATPRAKLRHALGPLADDWPAPDLGSLKKSFPNWFPVDVQFGSGAYMPLFDGARYQVFLDPRGAVRPPGRTGHGGRAQAPGLVS